MEVIKIAQDVFHFQRRTMPVEGGGMCIKVVSSHVSMGSMRAEEATPDFFSAV